MRGRVSLTQYLESQEDQDMTKLLYFTRTQERRREGGLYNSGRENMDGRSFNECCKRIMNLDLNLAFGEIWCIKCRDW